MILQGVETIFDDMLAMMKNLKKVRYEKYMEEFRDKYGHFFTEMTSYVEGADDPGTAASEIAISFVDSVQNRYTVKGKIKSRTQADLNFFMIYYTFPAILLTKSPTSTLIADTICAEWGKRFKNSNIGYTTYEKIHDSFRTKILGIF